MTASLSDVPPGSQVLYLTFTGTGTGLFDVDDFTLGRSTGNAGTGPVVGLAGKCPDISNGGSADGRQIHLWDCHSGANQQWRLP
ncbi:RICIN domain-containing protein [Actinoplanes xinjiangensis]|uniref:Ricin-type beta-trefoil lectin protein n=1 Tax=Actinoplanes xinjiangensis TaxID=512350 RepID=A0A316FUU7_9ACTN|nr:ricin-type beta-trefoil lectin protein [Actinoplanes xinjiangensis]GIF37215.1 hypothetical protein Axi01nite_15260 [Actinoplanes xinjiangensis]